MQTDLNEVLAFCESQRAWLLETIAALVRQESPSTDKAAVDRCGRELADRLRTIGGTVTTLPQTSAGDHVRAEFGTRGGSAPMLVLGHFDTVWNAGQIERTPLRQQGGRLHGPGVYDMKAGIAIAMLAMRALAAAGSTPHVVMLWTTDEEIGSATSRAIIEEEARRSRAVLVVEPSLPDGGVKTSRKGVGEFELVVHGVAAHAGLDPGKGASAILELAHQILAIHRLQADERGLTLNVGVIAGGSRSNVVADQARASIDVRIAALGDAEYIERRLRALTPAVHGTRLELSGGINRPPFERTSAVAALYGTAREVALALGRELNEGGTGGGSDGNFTGALGVPTLDGLGPIGDGAHALHEHVVVADLPWRAALLAGLLSRVGVEDGVK